MEERKEETRIIGIKGIAADDYLKSQGLRRTSKGRTKTAKRTTAFKQEGGAFNSPPGTQLSATAANTTGAAEMASRIGPIMTVQKGGFQVMAQTPGHTAAPQANPLTSSLPAIMAAARACTLPPNSTANNQLPAAAPIPPAPTNPIPIKQSGGGGAKVVLEPAKKKQHSKLLLAPSSGSKKSHKQPHSQTRKIKVGLAGMNKRITRAHKITKDSKEKSIDEIRKILESAKLIRPNKSVPEDIIRNIYKDYMLLRGKAL